MKRVLKTTIGSIAAAGMLATMATPAQAQRYHRYHHHHGGDDAAWAIGGGLIGLGIGAAIASSNHGYGDRYYGGYYPGSYYDGYYPGGYYGGYYSQGYYPRYSGAYYGHRGCYTERRYDRWGRPVRVRYCD